MGIYVTIKNYIFGCVCVVIKMNRERERVVGSKQIVFHNLGPLIKRVGLTRS